MIKPKRWLFLMKAGIVQIMISTFSVGMTYAVAGTGHGIPVTSDEHLSLLVEVSGTVTDESGEPLPGVNILVKGTTTGTTTDVNGAYRLEVENTGAVLVFSFIGYVT